MLLNILYFQFGWFACVIGAAHGMPWLGPLLAIPIVWWHLRNARIIRAELLLLAIVTLLGSTFDQVLLSLGWVEYGPSNWPSSLLPVWMVALWLLFSTTLNVSLRWMHGRTVIALIFGFFGGPLAYIGGTKLGALTWVQPDSLLIALASGWAFMMPALLWLSKRFDGYASMLNMETIQGV